jgi:hypothetical protein
VLLAAHVAVRLNRTDQYFWLPLGVLSITGKPATAVQEPASMLLPSGLTTVMASLEPGPACSQAMQKQSAEACQYSTAQHGHVDEQIDWMKRIYNT